MYEFWYEIGGLIILIIIDGIETQMLNKTTIPKYTHSTSVTVPMVCGSDFPEQDS